MSSQPVHRRPATPALVIILALVLAVLGAAVPASPAGAAEPVPQGTRVVRPGQSIQAALDAVGPGSVVSVRAGTYAEQLTVTKDGISLVGDGAVLVPPPSPVRNTCSGLAGPGTQAGICVSGRDVRLAPFEEEHRRLTSVGRRVQDVLVAGFEVRRFSGPNVAFVGAAGARLFGNRLHNGEAYGALSVGSKGTQFFSNTVSSNSVKFIGMCVDDVTPATVALNNVSGYVVGLCIQTQRADVARNRVHGNCIGIFVDPGFRAYVHGNQVFRNNAPCGDFAVVTGIGIMLQGSTGAEVVHNRITGHRPEGFGAGLVLVDDDPPGPLATDNVVRNNTFEDNTLDLQVASAGTGNVVTDNDCTTSDPGGLC